MNFQEIFHTACTHHVLTVECEAELNTLLWSQNFSSGETAQLQQLLGYLESGRVAIESEGLAS